MTANIARVGHKCVGAGVLLAVIAAWVLSGHPATSSAASAVSGRAFATAVFDPYVTDGDRPQVFKRMRTAGATFVRLTVWWPEVAPVGNTPPVGFQARDPSSNMYRWGAVDSTVRSAIVSGLHPIIYVQGAPSWVQTGQKQRPSDGPVRPSPSSLADFASALATRYSGSYAGLPRVRYWQIWNEPNLSVELMPQSENGKLVSPDWYRDMVNAAASVIHAAHSDNVVIAGGLAPFGGNLNDPSGAPTPNQERIHPLTFMRQMLCLSDDPKPKPTCNAKSQFDVWAHHPYTYGGPTHHANDPNDVSLGDLGEMRILLDAAVAAGHVQSRQKVGFWVTEFSYDSKPADPKGLDPALHARWVSEALYRMWQNGVSVVTWFLLRDQPFPQEMFQSGLYYRGANGIASDKPKPALRAFRFPFVAFQQNDRSITFWGRTSTSTKKALVVEQKQGSRWRRLASPQVDRYGIFQGRVTSRSSGSFRARLVSGGESSLPFSLTVPADFRFCPWGSFC